jgi:hypothetical protein
MAAFTVCALMGGNGSGKEFRGQTEGTAVLYSRIVHRNTASDSRERGCHARRTKGREAAPVALKPHEEYRRDNPLRHRPYEELVLRQARHARRWMNSFGCRYKRFIKRLLGEGVELFGVGSPS